MLDAAGLKGKFFVLAGRIGAEGYLSAEQISQMATMGMEIGLHGRDHRNWREVDAATLEDEVVAARAEIVEASGAPIRSVAIPFGAYNRTVMTRLQQDDFAKIYTSDPGIAGRQSRISPRNTVKGEHTLSDVAAMVEDVVPLKARLRRTFAPPIKRLLN
jgi:peptidoglycan/xylan/chitin deacetylase (PgdA/CDA1 family)